MAKDNKKDQKDMEKALAQQWDRKRWLKKNRQETILLENDKQ